MRQFKEVLSDMRPVSTKIVTETAVDIISNITTKDITMMNGEEEITVTKFCYDLERYTLDEWNQLLSTAKEIKIAKSKEMLAIYLQDHPLKSSCHGGVEKYYTVTEEKQNMLSRKFITHRTLVESGIEDTMTWNATGESCEIWTDEECIKLIAEMNAYVTPLVSYQQHIEETINSCTSKEEVERIVIDYDSVHQTTS